MWKKTENPYNQYLITFFDRINFLFGSYNLLGNQLKHLENLFKESLEKNNYSPEIIRAFCCLLMRDITEKPKSLCHFKYNTGKFEIKGDEYFKHLNKVKIREASWCISQSFEAFESFLKKVIYLTHELNPDCIDEDKRKKFEDVCTKQSKDKKNYLTNYFNFTYKYSNSLLPFLKNYSDYYKQFLNNNYRNLKFEDWLKFVSEARNAIVHHEMVIKYDKINWERVNPRFMNKYFPGSLSEKGYSLQIENKNVRLNLETFLEHGFLIYKSLSTEMNYDIIDLK
ncbi:MAG: hypothetical protein HN952_05295 [Candidatus Cloacimonetes bacterium]|nr:hypothetical protein [Candidatus Cloacimonadota bacterium]MBT6994356.1 hypothetical protein [Candidatus Cloacimonadota bacterium]